MSDETAPPFKPVGDIVATDGDLWDPQPMNETVYQCPSCAALVTTDGIEPHHRWHQSLTRMFRAAGVTVSMR